MAEADYKLYREAQEATHRLPPKSATAFVEQLSAQNGKPDVLEAFVVNLVAISGDRERARVLCATLLNRSRSAWSLGAMGNRCQETGEFDLGLARIDEALIIDPENVMALDAACGLLCLIGDFEQASAFARRAYDSDVDNPEGYHLVPTVQIIARDFATARMALTEAPATFVGSGRYWNAMAALSRDENRIDDAIAEITKATELDPYRAVHWGKLGTLLLKTRRYEDCDQVVQKIFELNPNHPLGFSLAARLAAVAGDYPKRDYLLAQVKKHSPVLGAFAHHAPALQFLASERPREAVRAFEAMEAEGEQAAKRLAREGKLEPLADLGRWSEVRKTLSQLSGHSLSKRAVATARARLIAHEGNIPEAMRTLEEAYVTPDGGGVELRWLLIFASETGGFECLRRIATKICDKLPISDSEVWRCVHWFYAVKAYEQGDRVLRAALERYPDSVSLRAQDHWRLKRQGMVFQAGQVRVSLPPEWQNWTPLKSLRPPSYGPLYELGAQFKRRFGIRS